MKRIGILTSGGDAPGVNAAIRSAVRFGVVHGMEMVGFHRGFFGIIENDYENMTIRSVSDIIQKGGTVLKSSRCEEFKTKKGQQIALNNLNENNIDGLIVIGGDGSFMGVKALSEQGFPAIGIPGTIDNDLAYTDFTLGYDTACNNVLDAINKIRETMESHNRVFVVEVMGRSCGNIALYTGLASGAEVIIIPEYKISMQRVIQKLKLCKANGKDSSLVIVAEGAGHAPQICEELKSRTKFSVRYTVLGHIQRGGSPSQTDRYLGTVFGVEAIKLLDRGIGNRILGIKKNKVYDIDIIEGLSKTNKFNKELYQIAMTLSI